MSNTRPSTTQTQITQGLTTTYKSTAYTESHSHSSSVILALAEGRGISEIGLCSLDLETGECFTYQVNLSFIKI